MRTRRLVGAVGLLAALLALAGCGGDSGVGEVTGTVTVDGQTPPPGSSITFVPTDGKSPTAGASIEGGRYTAKVPTGTARVEIRVPRPAGKPRAGAGGPGGPGPGGDIIEESLPPRYNEKTELTFDVKPGRNEKNWDLKSR